MGVAEDQRAPGHAEVQEALAVFVLEPGAGGLLEKLGRAAHGPEGADWAGDAPGKVRQGFGKQGVVAHEIQPFSTASRPA